MAALGVSVAYLVRGRSGMLRFQYYGTPLDERAFQALGERDGWQLERFEVEPGVVLRGLHRPAHEAQAPQLLFFAGNGADLLSGATQFLDALRGDHDWGLSVFAYRGFDGSGGTPSRTALATDAGEVAQRLLDRTAGPVLVVGFSLGSHLALEAAEQAGAAGRVRALALLAPFSAIEIGPAGWRGRLLAGGRYDNLPLAARARVPALVIHGSTDEALPLAQGRAVATALGGRATFHEVAGRGHAEILWDAGVLATLRGYLADALAGGEQAATETVPGTGTGTGTGAGP